MRRHRVVVVFMVTLGMLLFWSIFAFGAVAAAVTGQVFLAMLMGSIALVLGGMLLNLALDELNGRRF